MSHIDFTKTQQRIRELKEEHDCLILAHYYQRGEIQDIADYVGDSLGLSQRAASAKESIIVFCGVFFMAEGAKILSPNKKVIIPEPRAGCPMADMVDVEGLRALKAEHPDAAVVCYVNTTAAVKAECDICCTSSNAVKIVNSLPNKKIIFAPDRNLAHWVSLQTDKEIIPWQGFCNTHDSVTLEEVIA
ncbi:MAG: quinolinate synthase, partial [bacterium]|nr:quinolinate synthase [bacterium]